MVLERSRVICKLITTQINVDEITDTSSARLDYPIQV